MAENFRNALFATTMLAGIAMWTGAADAGPNSPNMPSISAPSISSARPNFNMRAPDVLRDREQSDENVSRTRTKKAIRKKNTIKAAPIVQQIPEFPATGPELTPATNIEQQAGPFPWRRGHKMHRPSEPGNSDEQPGGAWGVNASSWGPIFGWRPQTNPDTGSDSSSGGDSSSDQPFGSLFGALAPDTTVHYPPNGAWAANALSWGINASSWGPIFGWRPQTNPDTGSDSSSGGDSSNDQPFGSLFGALSPDTSGYHPLPGGSEKHFPAWLGILFFVPADHSGEFQTNQPGPADTPSNPIDAQAAPGTVTIPIPGQQPAGTVVPAANEKAVPIFGLIERPVEVSILGILGRPWLLPSVQKVRDSYSGPLHNPLLMDPGPLSKQTNVKAAKSLLTPLENAPLNRVGPGPLPAKANAAESLQLKAEPPAVPLKAELPASALCDFQGGCSVPSALKAEPPAAPIRESTGGTASGPPIGILPPARVQGGSDAEKAAGIQSRMPSGARGRDRK